MSDLFVLISTEKLVHHIFSPCPAEGGVKEQLGGYQVASQNCDSDYQKTLVENLLNHLMEYFHIHLSGMVVLFAVIFNFAT